MTYTIGHNCDLIFIHPNVNSGDPFGFVLTPEPVNSKSSAVSVQREITLAGVTTIYLFFTLLLADDLINPDGSDHAENRAVMYSMLLNYLSQTSGLTIVTVMGTWLGIGPLGHSATELHLVNASFVSIKLYNATTYHPPTSDTLFLNSLWSATPAEADALTWETSLWR
jgi:hypothetical protein